MFDNSTRPHPSRDDLLAAMYDAVDGHINEQGLRRRR